MEPALAGGTNPFGARGRVGAGLGTVDGEEGRKNPSEGVPGRSKVRVSSALTRKMGRWRGYYVYMCGLEVERKGMFFPCARVFSEFFSAIFDTRRDLFYACAWWSQISFKTLT